MIDFEFTSQRATGMSDGINSALSTLFDRFFDWKIENPDKCTPEIEQEFASLMLDWFSVSHQMVTCGDATEKFLEQLDDDEAEDNG